MYLLRISYVYRYAKTPSPPFPRFSLTPPLGPTRAAVSQIPLHSSVQRWEKRDVANHPAMYVLTMYGHESETIYAPKGLS